MLGVLNGEPGLGNTVQILELAENTVMNRFMGKRPVEMALLSRLFSSFLRILEDIG